MDDELIEMVAEDELDNEVEQADVINKLDDGEKRHSGKLATLLGYFMCSRFTNLEKTGLCIMDIDQALERTSSHVVTDPAATGGESSCMTPSTEDSDSIHTDLGGAPSTTLTKMDGDPPTLPPY